VTDLTGCDEAMCKADGTELKENIGGNAITAASFAIAEAGAKAAGVELFVHLANAFHGASKPAKFRLPTPMVNILNGGKHAGGNLKIQEFMILPRSDIEFREALRVVTTVYHHLGKILAAQYGLGAKNLGDEGGYAPSMDTADQALTAIESAVVAAGFTMCTPSTPAGDIRLAMDCAASEFFKDGMYEVETGNMKTTDEMVDFYERLVNTHPAICSIEDPLNETDYDGFAKMTARLGDRIMIVGDDLYTTNTNLLKKGIAGKWANALLLKVNQIGTITEAMNAARMEFEVAHKVIVSHRSGETVTTLISDLAVAIGAQFIKTGATARGERVAKYNRLLAIEDYLRENGMLAAPGSA